MEINYDNEQVQEFLNGYGFEYCYVDEITCIHGLTMRKSTIKDNYFVFLPGKADYNKPVFLIGYRLGDQHVRIHYDFDHPNVGTSIEVYTKFIEINGQEKELILYYLLICSPMYYIDFKRNPNYHLAVKLQWSGYNKQSPMRTCKKVSLDSLEPVLRDSYSRFISRNSSKLSLVTGLSQDQIAHHLTGLERREILDKLLKSLSEDKIFIKLKQNAYYKLKQDDDKQEDYSEYYPIITGKELLQEFGDYHPQRRFIDIAVLGCGSANSAIIQQLVRTTYAEKYFLLDYDIVEAKNLYNQLYKRSDIGVYKVSGMNNYIIVNAVKVCGIVTVYHKISQQNLQTCDDYRFKYLLLGFDNIESRKVILEAIEKGNIECEYLIDTRYDGMESSVFFIDTKKDDEMELYRELLEEDEKLLQDKTTENTCNNQNIIPIYNLTGTWVMTGIQAIENDERKPFTWVDLSATSTPTNLIMA